MSLKVPAGTSSSKKLRLSGRGLPKPRGGAGDLIAVAQVVVPPELNDSELALFRQLADQSDFNPRRHFAEGS